MGVDYDASVIIGFKLDSDKIYQWIRDNNENDDRNDRDRNYAEEDLKMINSTLKEIFPEIPDKKWTIYIGSFSNRYAGWCNPGREEFYLTFYLGVDLKIKDIKNGISEELFELAKEVYQELMDEEIDCQTIDDIEIFPAVNIT